MQLITATNSLDLFTFSCFFVLPPISPVAASPKPLPISLSSSTPAASAPPSTAEPPTAYSSLSAPAAIAPTPSPKLLVGTEPPLAYSSSFASAASVSAPAPALLPSL